MFQIVTLFVSIRKRSDLATAPPPPPPPAPDFYGPTVNLFQTTRLKVH